MEPRWVAMLSPEASSGPWTTMASLHTVVTPIPTPSPTPSSTDFEDQTFEQLAERYGITPDQFQDWGLQGWYLLSFVVAVALVVLILRAIYRGMQRPRLKLTPHEDRPPTASWQAVVRYLATPLFWVPLWFLTVLAVLVLAANRGETIRPASELVIAAAVVVGGARLLAHINLEGAHELAKSVPLTLLSLILISGQTISIEAGIVAIVLLLINIESLLYYLILLAVWDFMFTFGWLLVQRVRWRRGQRSAAVEAKSSWLRDIWDSVRLGWAGGEAGPSESQNLAATPHLDHADLATDARVRHMMLLPDRPRAQREDNADLEPHPMTPTSRGD